MKPHDVRPEDSTTGILNPSAGLRRFSLQRVPPSAPLAGRVDWHWVIQYALPEPFEQEVLPHPVVNVAIEARGSAVHGIGQRREAARLEGKGRVVATKMKPGGFHGFTRFAMRALVDRVVPLADAFGDEARALEAAVLAEGDDARAVALLDAFLASRLPPTESALEETMALALRAQTDREIRRAEDLARVAGVSLRTLHRAFERYVGIGPKWIVRRSRVQEAAERVAAGAEVAWAALAVDLGYHDQAHLIRDFKAQIGVTPAAYASKCAAAARRLRSEGTGSAGTGSG